MSRLVLFLLALPALGHLTGCRQEGGGSVSQGTYYANEGSLWPSSNINVCWDNPSAESTQYEGMVKNIIVSEFARAGLNFGGWNKCSPQEGGIHIMWSDEWPKSGVGHARMNGRVGGFKMAYDFRKNEAKVLSNACHASEETLKNCIELVALHEMGHAVGLAHENRRPETSCHQYGEQVNGEALAVIGELDTISIMNKCHYRPDTGQKAFRLSPGDIQTLRVLYSGSPSDRLQSLQDCKPGYTFFPQLQRCLISQDGLGGCKPGEAFDDGTGACKALDKSAPAAPAPAASTPTDDTGGF